MENKYYDHLKPKLPRQSFSDVVNEQLNIVQQQQQAGLAQQMRAQKDQQKVLDAQQKKLLGFDVSNFSDVDKEVFAAKRDWLADRINNFYYTGSNRGEFVNDVNTLSGRYDELEHHYNNISTEREALEGYVSGTKKWTDKNLRLADDINSLNYKNSQWDNSGIDPESLEIDPATGDAYGFYVDINGTRLKDDNGVDQFGPVQGSPTRGSKEYFSPTVTPYENLFPGEFSKRHASGANRLKRNTTNYANLDEKRAELRGWVTADVLNDRSAVATARKQFMENYGEDVAESILKTDQAKNEGQEGYIPMDLREYIDETMRFLEGNILDTPSKGSSSSDGDNVFPSSAQFNLAEFQDPSISSSPTTGVFGQPAMAYQGDEDFGKGITTLMVPKAGVGKSSMLIESSYVPTSDTDPRANEAGGQYRVLGVAVDESGGRNLFVRAEMTLDELTDEGNIYTQNLPGVIPEEGDTKKVKSVVPIVVRAVNEDGGANQEYQSILAGIGYAAGVKKGEDKIVAIKKGMQVLKSYNDSEAQIFASMPTP